MKSSPQIVTVVQTRTGSSRLPGKVLMPLCGETLLEKMMERLNLSKHVGQVVIATTTDSSDDPVVEICQKRNFQFFRGHPTDLLDRHVNAAKKFNADVVVKIPSDCPLIDPQVIDRVLEFYLENQKNYDFVSNLHPATYPDGNDVEVMPIDLLEIACREATKELEREHTTPFFWENPDRFKIGNVSWEKNKDYSMSHRFTIDYKEDYDFISRVFDELYPHQPEFTLGDILDLLERKPEIYEINSKYAGVNWYRNHLNELKTVESNQTRQI